MKKTVIIFTFIAMFQIAKATKIEVVQHNFNLNNIETSEDATFAYGNCGDIIASFDGFKTWKQLKVFDYGSIIKMFLEDQRSIAFNSTGVISLSADRGLSWRQIADLNDSIIAVISTNNNYYIRTSGWIIQFDNEFNSVKAIPFITHHSAKNYYTFPDRSIVAGMGNIYAIADSAKIIKYDKTLNIIDTLDLIKYGLCKNCFGKIKLEADSNVVYLNYNDNIYNISDFKSVKQEYSFQQSSKLINADIYFILYRSLSYSKLNFTLYKGIKQDSVAQIMKTPDKYFTSGINGNDFIIKNDKLLFCGDDKLLALVGLKDSSFTILSHYTSTHYPAIQIKVNDSSYLFLNYMLNNQWVPFISRTDDDCVMFRQLVDYSSNKDFYSYSIFNYKYYDNKNKHLYLAGNHMLKGSRIFISSDTGNTFINSTIKGLMFVYPEYNQLNVQKNATNFIMGYNTIYSKIHYNYIITFDTIFNIASIYKDSNMVMYYINSADTNSFLLINLNKINNKTEIKYTRNKGVVWNIIKEYAETDSLLEYTELIPRGDSLLAIYLYSRTDNTLSLDIFNLKTRVVKNIYKNIINTSNRDYYYHNITYDADKFYLTIKDTLFVANDLYNKSSWKSIVLPNHGTFKGAFAKYGERFMGYYIDDLKNYNNSTVWLKITDPDTLQKPEIYVSDIEINKTFYSKDTTFTFDCSIQNKSKESGLFVYNYYLPADTILKMQGLQSADSLHPIAIGHDSSYHFNLVCKIDSNRSINDSIVFISNAVGGDNVCYIKANFIDSSVTNVIDVSRNYLFLSLPFPVPAKTDVRANIYWDMSLDIDKDELGVYDIYGMKIGSREDVRIDKTNGYSGYLVWNCSSAPDGIYFVRLRHGDRTQSLKVMVGR